MITFNSIDRSYLNDLIASISNTVNNNNILGGLWNEQNLELSDMLKPIVGENIIVNSGTNAFLLALEWIESKYTNIVYRVSEYSYFWLWSYLKNKQHIILKTHDQVNIIDEPTDDKFIVYIITSHNETNCSDFVRSANSIIIEDRCQMFANIGKLNSDIKIYSFSNNKILQAGEGGCLASNNSELLAWARLRTFSDIQPARSNKYFFLLGQYQYGQSETPFKASISSILSSYLIAQCLRLETTISKRVKHFNCLTRLKFSDCQQLTSECPLGYPLYIDNMTNKQRLRFQLYMLKNNIQTYTGVLPYNHYLNLDYTKNTVMLPVHPELTTEQINHIINTTLTYYDNFIKS